MNEHLDACHCACVMTTHSTFLHSTLPAGQTVPEWIHLVPAGTFRGTDGRGPYSLPENINELISASMAAGKLAVDENHATDLAAKQGHSAPARGWIVELESRSDGIWGKVEWTQSGKALLEDHAYRGISPVIALEKNSRRVVQILRASLTNAPNLNLTHLHHSGSQDMNLLEQLRAALGLKAEATETEVLAAVTTANTAVAAHSANWKKIVEAAGLKADAKADDLVTHLQSSAADLAKLGEAAGIKDGVTVEKLVTHLQAQGGTGDEKTIIDLQTRLTSLQTQVAKDKATDAIDKAIADGKPIKPLRDRYIERHMKDPAGVQQELDALPSLHAGGVQPGRQAVDQTEASLDGDELQVCELMGIDPKEFAKHKKTLQVEKL